MKNFKKMAQITSLLDWENINYDWQKTSLHKALINPWIISGLAVTAGQVAVGEAFIECARSNGEKIMVHFANTSTLNIDTSGNKKIFIEVKQEHIDNGIINAEDGSNIAEIKSEANYPAKNFIKLASIRNGEITDESTKITLKNIARKGLTEDGFLVVEDGEEKVKTSLPENITNNIKTETEKQIIKYSGEIFEGVVREVIPDVITPVTFLEGWEYTEEVQSYGTHALNIARPYDFEIVGLSYTGTGNENKNYEITPYTDDGRALQTYKLYYPNRPNKTTQKRIKIQMVDNAYHGDSFKVLIKYRKERWFYKFTHSNVYGRLVGFLKNKQIGDETKIDDITLKHKVEFAQANGIYYISNDGLITTSNNTNPMLKLWEVKSGYLYVNLQNLWKLLANSYVHFWLSHEKPIRPQNTSFIDFKVAKNEITTGNFI